MLHEDCTPRVAACSPILARTLRGQQRLGALVDTDLFVLPSCHEDLRAAADGAAQIWADRWVNMFQELDV